MHLVRTYRQCHRVWDYAESESTCSGLDSGSRELHSAKVTWNPTRGPLKATVLFQGQPFLQGGIWEPHSWEHPECTRFDAWCIPGVPGFRVLIFPP